MVLLSFAFMKIFDGWVDEHKNVKWVRLDGRGVNGIDPRKSRHEG